MPATFERIATITKASDSASFSFTSIPQTYTDLYVSIVLTTPTTYATLGAPSLYGRFNDDSGGNYRTVQYYSSSGTYYQNYYSPSTSFVIFNQPNNQSGDVITVSMWIKNYTNTNKAKGVLSFGSQVRANSDGFVLLNANSWTGTAAISSFSIIDNASANYGSNSTATIYGILRA